VRHLDREIDNLKKKLLTLSALVEENARRALLAVESGDVSLAVTAIESDFQIDLMEVEIEEDCLKTLALYQPVAVDLRFLVAAVKINATLERIGDVAVNIAERAVAMAEGERPAVAFDVAGMADKAQAMISQSLDALVNGDTLTARGVLAADDEVDDLDAVFCDLLLAEIREHPSQVDGLLALQQVSRFIERLADHATSIAEDVIYMVEGEIPRHHAKRVAAQELGFDPSV
jgi:phosphate transport system protein